MNPEYENSLHHIREFWKFASKNLHLINPNDIAKDSKLLNTIISRGENPKDHYLSLTVSTLVYIDLTEKMEAIDSEIEIFTGNDFINFTNYDLAESVPSHLRDYISKLVVVRKCLVLSVSGNKDKFLLLDTIRSVSDEFEIPSSWHITIFKQRNAAYRDHILIPFVSGKAFGVSSIKFGLKSLSEFSSEIVSAIEPNPEISIDQQFDLMIILEDELASSLKSQDDVYTLRNSVFVWLETIIGEYSTSMNIARLTIIPEQGLTEMVRNMGPDGPVLRNSLKNGVYLIPELTTGCDAIQCELCGIQEHHTPLQLHKDDGTFKFDDFQHAHPHIREGHYCNFCFNLLEKINPEMSF